MAWRPGGRMNKRKPSILAISGGGDSRYLLDLLQRSGEEVILAHVHHGTRGRESDKDQKFVEKIAGENRIPLVTARMPDRSGSTEGFENRARRFRRRFLMELKERSRSGDILTGHTADDQVETILMRMVEGAGIGGLKGIPRRTAEGFYRPILHVWREDIDKYLKEKKIPFRTDRTNRDTRFERNWIRHVLIPLLVKRYGKAVKRRLFALGERFAELDDYLETEARRWIRRNVKSRRQGGRAEKIDGKAPSVNIGSPGGGHCTVALTRIPFSGLPSVLRIRILQKIGFDRLGLEPNERLLAAMDKALRSGGPSARVEIGKGWELVNRYDRAVFLRAVDHKRRARAVPVLTSEEKGTVTPAQARRAAASGRKEYFDAAGIRMPLSVRPLRVGDRIRPFGLDAEKKVKEILIDRKVPKGERWGRPVVCDGEGTILWIPGVVRSAHAPVGPGTKKTVLLKLGRK
jgi:tRNA(Ile)-lysidine synthase